MTDQLDLFQAEKAPAKPWRDIQLEIALSPEVIAETLACFQANPEKWMTSISCLDVKHKYNLGIEFNRTIMRLEQEGKIISRRIYSGTKEIGPHYYGFGYEWRLNTPEAAAEPLEIVRIASDPMDLLGNRNKKRRRQHDH